MALQQRRRLDFLRHIVNRILAESNAPRQLLDDIRRAVGSAEDKYKFNAFGGDVKRLADYLRSRDFDDLITIARSDRSGQGLELLRRILEEARKVYSDIPEVVDAIDARLRELEAGGKKGEDKLDTLYSILKDLEKLGAKIEKDEKGRKLLVKLPGDKLSATISYDEKMNTYRLELVVKESAEFLTPSEVHAHLKRVVETIGSG